MLTVLFYSSRAIIMMLTARSADNHKPLRFLLVLVFWWIVYADPLLVVRLFQFYSIMLSDTKVISFARISLGFKTSRPLCFASFLILQFPQLNRPYNIVEKMIWSCIGVEDTTVLVCGSLNNIIQFEPLCFFGVRLYWFWMFVCLNTMDLISQCSKMMSHRVRLFSLIHRILDKAERRSRMAQTYLCISSCTISIWWCTSLLIGSRKSFCTFVIFSINNRWRWIDT